MAAVEAEDLVGLLALCPDGNALDTFLARNFSVLSRPHVLIDKRGIAIRVQRNEAAGILARAGAPVYDFRTPAQAR